MGTKGKNASNHNSQKIRSAKIAQQQQYHLTTITKKNSGKNCVFILSLLTCVMIKQVKGRNGRGAEKTYTSPTKSKPNTCLISAKTSPFSVHCWHCAVIWICLNYDSQPKLKIVSIAIFACKLQKFDGR